LTWTLGLDKERSVLLRTSENRWEGFYYDGKTADRQVVGVRLAPGGIHIQRADGSSMTWPISEVRQTQGSFSSEQLRIEYGTNPVQAIFVTQPGFAAAVREAFPEERSGWRDQRSVARLLALGIAALAIAAALYVWGAPIGAEWVATRLPPEWDASLGQGVAERMAPPSKQCSDSVSLASLNSILERLLTAPGHAPPPYRFRMVVLRDSLVNAFAAPGGFIAVNSGLVAAARTPEEFAGVLAHEVSHVTKRHSTRAIIREMPLRLAVSAVAGGSSAEAAASFAGSLGALRYRRGDEAEADREGMRLLQLARIDPSGTPAFMRTLAEKNAKMSRLASYLTTHPYTPDRVTALEAMTRQANYQPTPLLSPTAWARIRTMCTVD
jgi:predicted Zn-dependent protease